LQFPALKPQQLLAVLRREPLGYVIVRQRGSHRRLSSRNGHPDIGFSFHSGTTISPGLVKKVFVGDVGLSEHEARKLLR
jgi:predicted RNA binding protein YcfA (HicA-like mRNA interferase family)